MSDCRELRFRREESRLSLEPESSAPVSGTGRKTVDEGFVGGGGVGLVNPHDREVLGLPPVP